MAEVSAVHRVGAIRDRTHEAPIEDFPVQPSQKDGLGRMCATHWKAYVAGLARQAKERTAASAASEPAPDAAEPGKPTTKRARTRRTASTEAPVAQESAGE